VGGPEGYVVRRESGHEEAMRDLTPSRLRRAAGCALGTALALAAVTVSAAADDPPVTAPAGADGSAPVSAPHAVDGSALVAAIDGRRVAAADEEPGSWLAHGRTYDEQRFSPLSDIDRENVSELGLAWSYETGTTRGLEATPIVIDGVLYATGNWGIVFALDAATGRERWRFDPQVAGQKARDACCDIVNRGVAVWQGRVYVGALDGRLIALDAATGEPIWQVQTTDPSLPYTITGAPRIVKGRVLIGNGGAEFGVRGYFSAYDAETGELEWRFYTVPASKAGPHEHPELAFAATTWPANALWESGLGGTVWDAMAYDPELDLLYVGVGNSSVYERSTRSPGGGDNLFLASILALKPESGRLVWHYQTTPGESWDYTATQHIVLADLEIEGRLRKVLMQAPKNGFFYVLDRATGELLSADPYVTTSWATGVDLETGRPIERPEAQWNAEERIVTPSILGGHNWHPMTFSPETGWIYIPSITAAYLFRPDPDFRFTPGRFNTAEDIPALMAEYEGLERTVRFCDPTHITAWDPVARKQVWRVNHRTPVPGGLLSTAGGLLFQGRGEGTLVAYDVRSGDVLWKTSTPSGVMAPPITYRAGGEQYVAVLAGIGGSHGGHFTELENGNEGQVLAFKRGGRAPMPPATPRPTRSVQTPSLDLSEDSVSRGRDLYAVHCMRCHGSGTKGSGLLPDLRYASPEVHASWNEIVLGGTRQERGMASFADVLLPADAEAIHAYVVDRAHHASDLVERAADWFGRTSCIPVTWMVD
jgi:quinohemoprotein ethanol dehydrogenase